VFQALAPSVSRVSNTFEMNEYIDRLLEWVGLAKCNGVSTLLIPNEKLIPRPKEADESTKPKANQQHYQHAIGSLGWLAGASRPDIAYAVSLLGHFSQDPGETHWQGVKRVFRYVAGTKGLRLRLGGKPEVDLTAAFDWYVDADFAGDSQFRSTSGYIFRLGIGAVSWCSKKQTITALSTADAEFIASAAAIQELLWFRQLLCCLLRTLVLPPTVLYNDNAAALASFFDDEYRPHSRHIGMMYYRVRELVEDRSEVDMRYCATGDMVADGLTKGLDRLKQAAFVRICGLV